MYVDPCIFLVSVSLFARLRLYQGFGVGPIVAQYTLAWKGHALVVAGIISALLSSYDLSSCSVALFVLLK